MHSHGVLTCALVALSLITGLLTFQRPSGKDVMIESETPAFRAFRDNYVFVYAAAMAGDWLQGPYIYYLYEHYGFTVGPIGQLFIAGFASSMLFGTLAGVLADKYGRRRACLAYCLSYIVSCLTKHSSAFGWLLFGRLLGGVSTSLLFSSFEAWVASEHTRRGFDEPLLAGLFSRASTVGAGLMAITAGLIGDVLVERMSLGPVAPFDAAIVVLVLTGMVVVFTWTENYGGESQGSVPKQLTTAIITITSDSRIALLGALQALFEATLYTFVFLWTPALSANGDKVPHGLVFSCYMAACMAGSALAGRLLVRWRPQQFMIWVYWAAVVSMIIPFVIHLPGISRMFNILALGGRARTRDLAPTGYLQIAAFCVFELCLGIFWPAMMTLRAQLVPEEMRSTIINCFRIPLNLFVCVALFKVGDYSLATMFGLCIALLSGCVLCQILLSQRLEQSARYTTGQESKLATSKGSTCHIQAGQC